MNWQRVASVTFALAGLLFIGWSVGSVIRDPNVAAVPGAWTSLWIAVLISLGLLFAALGWAAVLGVRPNWRLLRGFYVAQLGKYIPGGVWQAVGQSASVSREQGNVGAATAFVASVSTYVAGGLAFGALAVVNADLGLGRLAALPLAVLAALACSRTAAHRVVSRLGERSRIMAAAARRLPSQRGLLQSAGLAALTLATTGLAFWIAIAELTPGADYRVVPAYALAWTAGFLFPLAPAGLGVREGTLVLLVPDLPPEVVVAGSTTLRVFSMIIESAFAAVSSLVASRSSA